VRVPALLLGMTLVVADALRDRRPRRLVFDTVQDIEGVYHGAGDASKTTHQRTVELRAPCLVAPVENLIDHDGHPFLCSGASERQWEAVEYVVGGVKRPFHQLQAPSLVESAPCPCGRAARIRFGDLLDRPVFDERTCAVAISHGISPNLVLAAGEGGYRGEGFFLRRRLSP
jgi:hypothetical protein